MLAAGMEILREKSYADLTVRAVAARAKVAPATAYTYFSSKNHLIAEVYLDLVRQVPYFTDVNDPMPTRVDKALRHLALVVADEPEVGAACTTALLGGGTDPAVRAARDRIGAEIHRRIASAIGPDADPAHGVRARDDVLRRTGAGRQRRNSPTTRSPTGWPTWSASSCRRRRDEPRRQQPPMTVHVGDHELVLDPYDYDFHEDPYPYYKRLRDEAPLYRNEELKLLGVVAAQRRAAGLPQQHHAVQPRRRLAGPGVARDRTRQRRCRSWRWTIPAHLRLRTLVSKGFTPRRIRELEPRVTELAVQHLDAMLEKASRRQLSTTSRNSPASCRWTSSPS